MPENSVTEQDEPKPVEVQAAQDTAEYQDPALEAQEKAAMESEVQQRLAEEPPAEPVKKCSLCGRHYRGESAYCQPCTPKDGGE